jgi:hypothetical protein
VMFCCADEDGTTQGVDDNVPGRGSAAPWNWRLR